MSKKNGILSTTSMWTLQLILESDFVLVLNIKQLFCQTKDRAVGNSRLDILPYILLSYGLGDRREIEVCLACQL